MLLIKNGYVIDPESGREGKADILISDDGIISKISDATNESSINECDITECSGIEGSNDTASGLQVIDADGLIVTAGLIDGHVHFRDPGQTYKEDIITGASAAAKGGYTSVIMMGNTIPHMDNPETLKYALEKGATTGINTYVCGNVTMGMEGRELTDMPALIKAGAVLFTDDGKPVIEESLMKTACENAARLNKVISLHEENPKYIKENGVNSGSAAESLGLTGSDRMAEISMVERDIRIAAETGCALTIQHISTKEAVELIRQARKNGANIHAEATPHHFTLTDEAVKEHGTLAKMNPPLRKEDDRLAIIKGLQDGTIDMIATDHAPHSKEEKDRDFKDAPSGIIGLETAFSLGLRELVEPGYLTIRELLDRMSTATARLYELPGGAVKEGAPADLMIFDKDEKWVVPDKFASKASNSPFIGETMPGVIKYTIASGKVVYKTV